MDLKQVMIVDDDAAVLGLFETWVTDAGYEAVTCRRFEDAKQYLASHQPDVLVTDVRLGAFNGLQLALFAKQEYPRTARIVLSAFDDPVVRREAAECGAQFLLKPLTSDEFLASVAAATRGPEGVA